jgi:hypothetical protein
MLSMIRRMIFSLMLFCVPMFAQVEQAAVKTKALELTVANPVQVVKSATVTVTIPGERTLYYWLVSHKGNYATRPAGPFTTFKAAAALTSSRSVTITWTPVDADTYDLLRTTSAAVPSGACNCAIATGLKGSSFKNIADVLQAYTVNSYGDTSSIIFKNEDL